MSIFFWSFLYIVSKINCILQFRTRLSITFQLIFITHFFQSIYHFIKYNLQYYHRDISLWILLSTQDLYRPFRIATGPIWKRHQIQNHQIVNIKSIFGTISANGGFLAARQNSRMLRKVSSRLKNRPFYTGYVSFFQKYTYSTLCKMADFSVDRSPISYQKYFLCSQFWIWCRFHMGPAAIRNGRYRACANSKITQKVL